MDWESTLNIVANYKTIIEKMFSRLENEKSYVERFNIPEATTKKTYQGFSLDTLFLNIKESISYVEHKKYTSYYWNDYYFLEARIVELTPEDFIKFTYQIEGKEFTNINNVLAREDIIDEVVEQYKEQILENENKFDLPYLEFVEGIFDGRHSVLAAYKAGLTGIPCMIFI